MRLWGTDEYRVRNRTCDSLGATFGIINIINGAYYLVSHFWLRRVVKA